MDEKDGADLLCLRKANPASWEQKEVLPLRIIFPERYSYIKKARNLSYFIRAAACIYAQI
jgi:hypothetical protein